MHACFHVLLQLVLTFDTHRKRVHYVPTNNLISEYSAVMVGCIFSILQHAYFEHEATHSVSIGHG